jgi:hypothetical protein
MSKKRGTAKTNTSASPAPRKLRSSAANPKRSSTKRALTKASAPTLPETSKLGTVVAMLRRKEGATISQLVKATGWQAHSVRGAMSGAVKKKLGLTISSTKTDGVRTYRVGGG